jgi:hypothetical protein
MSRALIAEVVLGYAPEFFIDKRDQRIEGLAVTAAPSS